MICPACKYVMDNFDIECPRCHGKGLGQPQQQTAPSGGARTQALPPINITSSATAPTTILDDEPPSASRPMAKGPWPFQTPLATGSAGTQSLPGQPSPDTALPPVGATFLVNAPTTLLHDEPSPLPPGAQDSSDVVFLKPDPLWPYVLVGLLMPCIGAILCVTNLKYPRRARASGYGVMANIAVCAWLAIILPSLQPDPPLRRQRSPFARPMPGSYRFPPSRRTPYSPSPSRPSPDGTNPFSQPDSPSPSSPNSPFSPEASAPPVATLAEFNQLNDGISYSQACAIIGEQGKEIAHNFTQGNEDVESSESFTYQWLNADGTFISATFQNDKLVGKTDSGLK